MKTQNPEIRIGDLAKQSGLGVETLRFYEQRGLIEPAGRRSSGYRIYNPQTLHRLHFIQKAKAIGFSLEEIKQLLELNQHVNQSCHGVREQVTTKLASVESRIQDLLALRQSLHSLLQACDGSAPIADCPILQCLRCPPGDLHE